MAQPTTKDIYLLTQKPELASMFDQVYGTGAASAFLAKNKPNVQQPTQSAPASQYMGAAIRGLAPSLIGATALSPLGPLGLLVGGLAIPATDALTALTNMAIAGSEKVTGKELPFRFTPPSQTIQGLLTDIGVDVPTSLGPKMLQAGAGALSSTATSMKGLQQLGETAITPLGRNVSQAMSTAPITQFKVAPPAAAIGQAVSDLSRPYAGDVGADVLGLISNVAYGSAFMPKQPRAPSKQSNADLRAAATAERARQLGFTGDIALTPGQAGTNKTAQTFEAVASTLPGGAGQFKKRFNAQNDYAEQKLNEIADIFGGFPQAPDSAFNIAAAAVKRAGERHVDSIGNNIRSVASSSDIDLSQVPQFVGNIQKARELLSALPPSMRKDPLFQGFEEFYFGVPAKTVPNENLSKMVSDALVNLNVQPNNPSYQRLANDIRQKMIAAGTPETITTEPSFEGLLQKGFLKGSDYQDQRKLFSDLAFMNKGTKVGSAFRSLRDALDDARDTTFRANGQEEQATLLKALRSNYGDAKDLSDNLAGMTNDQTVVNYISSNQNKLTDKILPLMSDTEKAALQQGILADIKLGSLSPQGNLDITKFGKKVIAQDAKTPSTLPSIFGEQAATDLVNLADVAQTALKPKMGSSMTSERKTMTETIAMPSKVLGAMATGTALTGEPILGPALSIATPYLASKTYLNPMVQKYYDQINLINPMKDYFAAPQVPISNYLATPGAYYGEMSQPQGLLGQ